MDKYDLPASYQLLSESGEATSSMLDKKVGVGFHYYWHAVRHLGTDVFQT